MRSSFFIAVGLTLVLAGPAAASMGGAPAPEPAVPRTDPAPGAMLTPRQQAEQLYGDAYDDVARANKDFADGKDKNAGPNARVFSTFDDHACGGNSLNDGSHVI